MAILMILASLLPQDCANGQCTPPARRVVRSVAAPVVKVATAPVLRTAGCRTGRSVRFFLLRRSRR